MGFFIEPRAYPSRRQIVFGKLNGAIFLERALLWTGALLLGWCGWTLAHAHAYQSYQSWSLDRLRNGQSETKAHWAPRSAEEKETAPARGDLVGRLDIPRLGLSAIVLEGADDETLRLGIGHVPGTALPGPSGNVALAAHRDTFFHPLRRIRAADEIELTTPRHTYRYRVDSVRIVGPDDTTVLRRMPRPSLTLVTCYPFHWVGNAPKRFVVQAFRLDSD
jgi:sortase A